MTDLSLFTMCLVRNPRHGREGRVGMAGVPSLLAVLKDRGREVEAENFFVTWDRVTLADVKRLAGRLIASPGRCLGVSTISLFLPMLLPALEQFRRARPDTPVILGGYGPTEAAELLLAHCPAVDVVVRGEGEETLVELLEALERRRSLREVGGISSRDERGVFSTPDRPRIRRLDALPFPDYEGAHVEDFGSMAVQLVRGCPFSCRFCSVSSVWTPTAVARSVERPLAEIDTLVRRHGLRQFVMADDTLNLSRRRLRAFAEGLRDLGHRGLWWHAFMRVDRVEEETLAIMAEAGCGRVMYGIETGSQEVLDRQKDRAFRIQDALETALRSARHIDQVMLGFVYGFPEETWEDYLRTVQVVVHLLEQDLLNRLTIFLDPVFAYPSTPLARENALVPVRDPRLLIRRYRAGHALSRDLLRRCPALCTFSVNVPSPHLEAKHRMSLDVWEVLDGRMDLDGFLRRHGPALRGAPPPPLRAEGTVSRFLRRVLHPVLARQPSGRRAPGPGPGEAAAAGARPGSPGEEAP